MRSNILLEFSAKNDGPQAKKALDFLEEDFKKNELFLVDWQRKGKKIRVFSMFSEIMNAINKRRLSKYQLRVLQYKKIEEGS